MKIVLTSSKYILVVVYYPLILIPEFLTKHLKFFSIDDKYIPFYFIISKDSNKPVKRFLSKTKAEHSYHTFNKEEGLITSFSPLYLSFTITTEEINEKVFVRDISFNCDSTIENSLEQDELNLIASISNTLANYINKVMAETISKKEMLYLKKLKIPSSRKNKNDYQ